MLLTRSLPPQFLLPAWTSHQLAAVQRVYNSTESERQKQKQASTSRESAGHQLRIRLCPSNSFSSPSHPRQSLMGLPPYPAVPKEKTPKPRPEIIQPHKERKATPKKTKAREIPPSSLFDHLFPEESHTKSPKQRMAEHMLDRLPAFEWTPEINIGDRVEKQVKQNVYNQMPRLDPRRNNATTFSNKYTAVSKARTSQEMTGKNMIEEEWASKSEKGVLVLQACSKTLEESDFFRISPKGQHIEGWKSGLLKGLLALIWVYSISHVV